MNELTSPLPADTVDELLSAELDGEFDAAAAELGLTAAVARARLDATPGVEHRRAALAAARDALAAPVEIEELLAARLRAKAVRAGEAAHEDRERARRARRGKRLYAIGGIAAALVVALAIAGAVTSSSSHEGVSTNAAGAPTRSHASTTPEKSTHALAPASDPAGVSFGSYRTMNDLTAGVAASRPKRAYSALPGDLSVTNSPPKAVTASGDTSLGAEKSAGAVGRCDAVHDSLATGGTLSESGYAELSGRPVLVRVYLRAGHRVITVTSADCTPVASTVVR